MEIILNIAWALCSLGLVWFWLRAGVAASDGRGPGRVSRQTQIFALAMVVMLLLPVISLSDDLVAAQGPAETDSCLRRATHIDEGHPSVVPASITLPEEIFLGLGQGEVSAEVLESYRDLVPSALVNPDLDSRPPPMSLV